MIYLQSQLAIHTPYEILFSPFMIVSNLLKELWSISLQWDRETISCIYLSFSLTYLLLLLQSTCAKLSSKGLYRLIDSSFLVCRLFIDVSVFNLTWRRVKSGLMVSRIVGSLVYWDYKYIKRINGRLKIRMIQIKEFFWLNLI